MPSSEHVYCVAVTFKMTEQVQQWTCIKFCVKLEHSSIETIWMIQKAIAIGHRLLATSSRQRTRLCITSHAEFLAKHKITQVIQLPHSPDLAPCDFWLFPKLNHLWKGGGFRPSMRFRKILWGNWRWLGELGVAPRCYFEGDWGITVLCIMFLVSCIFFSVSIFHTTRLDTFCTKAQMVGLGN